jgi:hypothetical protein
MAPLAFAMALLLTQLLLAQPPGPAPSASASAAPELEDELADAGSPRPDVAEAHELARRLRALVDDELEVAIDPAALFDVDLDDERAIAVEAERLRRIVAWAEGEGAVDAGVVDAGAVDAGIVDAGIVDAGAVDAGAGADRPPADYGALDGELLEARLAVDRARLSFYELPEMRRDELFARHAKRQKAGGTERQLSEAEQQRQSAAEERDKALRDAAEARSEAERAVAEERARLLGIKERQAALAGALIERRQLRKELLQRLVDVRLKADKVLDAPIITRPPAAEIDALYDEVALRIDEARERVLAAVAALSEEPDLPRVGEERLGELAVEVDRKEVDRLRAELFQEERELLERYDEQRWDRALELKQVLEELDGRRLQLMPLLTGDKRSRLTGFGPEGLGQAKDEIAHVAVIFRYHLRFTRRVVGQIREEGADTDSAIVATVTALKWVLPVGLFLWWRRRAERVLARGMELAEEARIKAQGRASPKSLVERVIGILRRVRSALEWLLLVWAVVALLPHSAEGLLEVQLLSTALFWLFGGRLVVLFIDALFSESVRGRRTRRLTAHLRLRSFRLIGRVIVVFGMILALTQDLVGKGTIYSWVFSTCWLSAVPIAVVIVRWWREVIFDRIGGLRRKGRLLAWVESTQGGLGSIVAAVVGGGYLLGHGVVRFLRTYVTGFDVTKRLLAYWFRRHVEKQAERKKGDGQDEELLECEAFDALSPERRPKSFVPSVADAQIKEVISIIHERGGAVYALVGERGSGKTTLLQRIARRTPDTALVSCAARGMDDFREKLVETLGVDAGSDFDAMRDLLNKRRGDNALLVDDAHHLLRPVVDGLEGIDALLALARASSLSCTWVFSFDSVLWQLFRRAREVRPLFDDIIELRPWSEEGIVRLLEKRSSEAAVIPEFGNLVTELPDDADDFEREEALERARAGYYRLIWDYSQGNPAVALHFWRMSLRRDAQGRHLVRLFEPPRTGDLERLPDSTVFVLRAVVQFGRPTLGDIVDATMLGAEEVESALRYAVHRDYLETEDERYHVRWTWFRTITRFLVRRHLLTGPRT